MRLDVKWWQWTGHNQSAGRGVGLPEPPRRSRPAAEQGDSGQTSRLETLQSPLFPWAGRARQGPSPLGGVALLAPRLRGQAFGESEHPKGVERTRPCCSPGKYYHPALQVRKQRLSKVKRLPQGHTRGTELRPAPKSFFLTIALDSPSEDDVAPEKATPVARLAAPAHSPMARHTMSTVSSTSATIRLAGSAVKYGGS